MGQTPASSSRLNGSILKTTEQPRLTALSLSFGIGHIITGKRRPRDKVMSFKGTLQPGKTVRVHSGSGPDKHDPG